MEETIFDIEIDILQNFVKELSFSYVHLQLY